MSNKITEDQKKQLFRYVELLYAGTIRNHGFCTYVGEKIGMPADVVQRYKRKMLRQLNYYVFNEKSEPNPKYYIEGIPKQILPAYAKIVATLAE